MKHTIRESAKHANRGVVLAMALLTTFLVAEHVWPRAMSSLDEVRNLTEDMNRNQ